MKKRRKTSNESNRKMTEIFKMLIKSTAIFLIILLISAALCYITDMEFDKYYLVMLSAGVISAFVSGLSYSRKMKTKGIFHGIAASLPIDAEVLAAVLIICGKSVSVLLPLTLGLIILSGAVSGTVGVNFGR